MRRPGTSRHADTPPPGQAATALLCGSEEKRKRGVVHVRVQAHAREGKTGQLEQLGQECKKPARGGPG
nr:MAG TPA: hypothetical protein [Caudoviricetes sp.]